MPNQLKTKSAIFTLWVFLVLCSFAHAELKIDSVYPSIGKMGEEPNETTELFSDDTNNKTRSFQRDSASKPNLTPYKPSKWTDKIVVSKSTGTNTDDKITSANDIYIDWAVINDTDVDISSEFYTAIYVDGVYLTHWVHGEGLQAGYYSYIEDYNIGRLSAGVHIIKIVVDFNNIIDEISESDNEYIKTINIVTSLKIESVYPTIGKMGEPLNVTIKGSGFDENTRVSMAVDAGNSAKIIGSVDTPDWAKSVTVVGSIAYIADGSSGLQVVDISNPANPTIIGKVDTPGTAYNVTVVGSIAYIADYDSGLQVIDISNPANPAIIGSVDTPGSANDVTVVGSLAYIADYGLGLQVIDISNPANPAIIGSVDTPGYAESVTVVGSLAYIADGGSGLQVIDISNPAKPAIIGQVDTPEWARSVTVVGSLAYIADSDSGLQVIDISNPPAKPQIIGSVSTLGYAHGVTVVGSLAYIADSDSGLQVIDISNPAKPAIIGQFDTGYAYDVTVVGSIAYITGGHSGFNVIDISNPANPAIIGQVDTPGSAISVTVVGSLAYIADNTSGLRVIDISNPATPAIIGSVSTLGYAHGVTVVGSLAYIANSFSGLQVIDISNPASPKIIGSVDTPGSANGVTVVGSIAYIADDSSGLQVIDISNPANPAIIGQVNTPGWADGVTVVGSLAYIADGRSGLQVVDISNPAKPAIIGSVDTPGWARSVTVVGSIAYIADVSSGLQVIDISNPANPAIIGQVDTPGWADGVTVVGSLAYIADSRSGLQVIDISNPANPAIMGSVNTPGYAHGVTVVGSLAYIANNDAGLTIVPLPVEVTPTLIDSNTLEVTLPAPQLEGNYNLRIFNNNGESLELRGAVTFFKDDDYQQKTEMKAVIVLGGKYTGNAIWEETRLCANYAYKVLLSQGYKHENIYYLSDEDVDVDKDGLNDVDGAAASADFSYAVNEWALDASELFIYMVDHGGNGSFTLSKTEKYFKATDLDNWLDNLQSTMTGRVVVVYDACYSGSFIPLLTPPPGKERIVITSAKEDEPAWFDNQGHLSFSFQFWASVFSEGNLHDSYLDAANIMKEKQTSMFDADGNGTGPDTADQNVVRNIKIGRGWKAASLPPEILEVSQNETLAEETYAKVWAKVDVNALSSISRVFAVVKSPEVDFLPSDQAVSDLPEIELVDVNAGENPDSADGIFEGSYNDFKFKGEYTLYVYAVENQGSTQILYSLPSIIKISKTQGLDPNPNPAAPTIKVLTESSPYFGVKSGEYVKVFGSDGINTLNIASGAKVECVNFPGQNQIIINEASSNFTVKRSGAVVIFQSSIAGTMVKIPASTTNQTINFTSDSRSFKLVITGGKVKLGILEVGLVEVAI